MKKWIKKKFEDYFNITSLKHQNASLIHENLCLAGDIKLLSCDITKESLGDALSISIMQYEKAHDGYTVEIELQEMLDGSIVAVYRPVRKLQRMKDSFDGRDVLYGNKNKRQ